jgi:hypothetical protein
MPPVPAPKNVLFTNNDEEDIIEVSASSPRPPRQRSGEELCKEAPMPFDLPLPQQLARARWKVKIFDKENREPPHITIVRGTAKWRIDLRKRAFMDRCPPLHETWTSV